MAYSTYLWWFGGWFDIVLTTLMRGSTRQSQDSQDFPGLLVGEDAHDGSGSLRLQHVVSAQCEHLWMMTWMSAVRWCQSSENQWKHMEVSEKI